MNPYISKSLACQIVNTVSDLCGQNVNFIDCSGIIFASTNEERIGDFHEIGMIDKDEKGVDEDFRQIA